MQSGRERRKIAKLTSNPKLESLPPTNKALELNIMRAHLQTMIWKSSLESNAPLMEPADFGWIKDHKRKILIPAMLPQNIKAAPDNVLKRIRCTCETSQCKNLSCSCDKSKISCSEFCKCMDGNVCLNEHTKPSMSNEDSDEEDDDLGNQQLL